MTREAMLAPFADEELHTFKGRGNQTMTYVEDETVMDRLDLGYGPGNWQVQVDAVSETIVKVRLGVRSSTGEWVWYEDFGYPNREGGESLKEAVSDGIRRAGRFVGIARDLYRKAPDERRTDSRVMAPPPTPASFNAAERERLVPKPAPTLLVDGDGSLIGTGELAKDFLDFLPKMSPEGMVIAFKLVSPAGGIKVIAKGALAEVLPTIREDIIGKRVSCWGRVRDETFTKPAKGTTKAFTSTYQVLDLERIKTESGTLPMQLPEPPDDVELVVGL